jgi:hypothetical protein
VQDPPYPRLADLDVVVAPEIHRYLAWGAVGVAAQVNDLLDDLGAVAIDRAESIDG